MSTKKCSACREVLPVEDFWRRSALKSGYKSQCKSCSRAGVRRIYRDRTEAEKRRVTLWKNANPDRVKGYDLQRYGLTLAQYDEMLQRQGGACALCREAFESAPQVDHCHRTQRVRGLLCRLCNLGIGKFRDNPALLRSAAEYVEECGAVHDRDVNAALNILALGRQRLAGGTHV